VQKGPIVLNEDNILVMRTLNSKFEEIIFLGNRFSILDQAKIIFLQG